MTMFSHSHAIASAQEKEEAPGRLHWERKCLIQRFTQRDRVCSRGHIDGGGPRATAFAVGTEVARGDRVCCGSWQVSEEGAIERAFTEATAFAEGKEVVEATVFAAGRPSS